MRVVGQNICMVDRAVTFHLIYPLGILLVRSHVSIITVQMFKVLTVCIFLGVSERPVWTQASYLHSNELVSV